MKRLTVLVAPVVGLVTFFAAWEALVRAFDVQPAVLQAPSRILDYLLDHPAQFAEASFVTTWHAAAGAAIALAISVLLGAILAGSVFLERAAQPVLVLIQVTPFVAYVSAVVIGVGYGDRPVLFVTALTGIPAFTFAVTSGLRSADPASRELLQSVDASRWEVLWRLRFPSALPSVLTTSRFAIGLALIVSYFAEGANLADEGLGAMGKKAQGFASPEQLWAVIFCMAAIGSIALLLITALERRVIHWHPSQRQRPGSPGGRGKGVWPSLR